MFLFIAYILWVIHPKSPSSIYRLKKLNAPNHTELT